MDAIGLQDRDAFWQLLSGYPQVNIILFGHVHQAYAEHHVLGAGKGNREATIAVYGCPAMADQFLPGAEQFAIDEASRPGYRVIDLAWSEALGSDWQSWVERIDELAVNLGDKVMFRQSWLDHIERDAMHVFNNATHQPYLQLGFPP